MNLINFLYRLYFSLPNFGRLGKLGKGIDRGLDTYVLKKIFDKKVYWCTRCALGVLLVCTR